MKNLNKTHLSDPENSDFWVISSSQMAQMLRVSTRVIHEFVAQGMPIVSRGARGKGQTMIDLGAAFMWARKSQPTKLGRPPEKLPENDPKHRERVAMADLRELALAEKRGEMMPIAALEGLFAEIFVEFRRAMITDQPPEIADISARHLIKVHQRLQDALENPRSLTEFGAR